MLEINHVGEVPNTPESPKYSPKYAVWVHSTIQRPAQFHRLLQELRLDDSRFQRLQACLQVALGLRSATSS
ncbi:hypothetical protein DPX16_17044 [Anabarilius grahami]|uniref:Uncharacterized protein n=1 Tax=Anabarilius grahami TaxID=495550 RepID=A0A3N0YAF5_ANAGA|nr:hypothetical protein DPX16_17044 [Anabarilius grahami]